MVTANNLFKYKGKIIMKLKYICQYCSKELTRHNILLKHEQICKLNPINGYNTIYKCKYCNKIYTHKYVFNRHLKTHIEYKPKEYIWQCKYCENKPIFKTRKILENHIKLNHKENKTRLDFKDNFICQYCNNDVKKVLNKEIELEELENENKNR